MFPRDLNQISIERNISEASQKHLKRDDFFCDVFKTSQRHLKKIIFCDVFKTSQKHLKKDGFRVTSLRRFEHISERCLFRDISQTSQKYLSQVFVTF